MGLAENLIAAREKAKLSQAEAARRADCHNVWLCNLEHGDGEPSLDLLRRLAEVYGTTVEKLMKGE